ncbi:MAG: hypothetical protein IH840_08435 [Candidatus Heimdallarchaeota archaeon]|nr:hypothetical protein [Candidatus Heimdallarchaeota archaeon]
MVTNEEIQNNIQKSIADSIQDKSATDQLQVLNSLLRYIADLMDDGLSNYVEIAASAKKREDEEFQALHTYVDIIVEALKNSPNLKKDVETLKKDILGLIAKITEMANHPKDNRFTLEQAAQYLKKADKGV